MIFQKKTDFFKSIQRKEGMSGRDRNRKICQWMDDPVDLVTPSRCQGFECTAFIDPNKTYCGSCQEPCSAPGCPRLKPLRAESCHKCRCRHPKCGRRAIIAPNAEWYSAKDYCRVHKAILLLALRNRGVWQQLDKNVLKLIAGLML